MKILYLYAEIMGYQIPIFKEYISKYNAEVHVVHDVKGKLTNYQPPNIEGLTYYDKDNFKRKELNKFVINLNPSIVYISGWMYKDYLKAARVLRKLNIPVITGIDDIWWKTFKQRIASFLFPLIKRNFFSHAWVAGPYQFEYAKRIGFNNDEIIFNCLSADIDIFSVSYKNSINIKMKNYPHRFLFAGRFEYVKGIDLLLKAWGNLEDKKKDWELIFVGNGSLKDNIKQSSNVIVYDFMQPEKLMEIIKDIGCFVLPSRFEPWALVLHEFTSAGLPIICSDVCGASPIFVTHKFNGFVFKNGNIEELESSLLNIINMTDKELIFMANNSNNISNKISPELSAACFISVLK